MIFAIDPGTTESAIVRWDGAEVAFNGFLSNTDLADFLRDIRPNIPLVIEKVESYGMAVGVSTFETVYWSGIFAECYGLDMVHRMGRKEVKLHHCGTVRATDANIRQAIYDRYGGKEAAMGKKSAKGPLFGVTGHMMAALALAMAWMEKKS